MSTTSTAAPKPSRIGRRRIRRVVMWLCGGALCLALSLAVAVWLTVQASLPITRGQVSLAGLSAPVEIHSDQYQRPYVQAAKLEDALAAQGWLHATNRLWQMELFRRAGRGRLSQLLGSSLLATDQQLYRMGVPQLAEKLERNATEQLLQRIEAYLSGVNRGIASLRARPAEFLLLSAQVQPWTRQDVFAVGAMMAYQSSGNTSNELFRLELSSVLDEELMSYFLMDSSQLPDFPYAWTPAAGADRPDDGPSDDSTSDDSTSESDDATSDDAASESDDAQDAVPSDDSAAGLDSVPAVHATARTQLPQLPDTWTELQQRLACTDPSYNPLMPRIGMGSNGWCVSPEKSTTGHALFAFDSHDELGLPNLFYEVHLFFGDGQQLRGWSVAGLPGVINGYNHQIAWGFTSIGDTQDLFLETQHPEDPDQFLDADQWYSVRTEQVELPVAGSTEPQPFTIRYTKNGPLISDQPPISVRWAAHDIGDLGLDAILDLNLAEDWTQFNAALDRLPVPSLNATYADVEGNIGFRTAGMLPDRSVGHGLIPLAGDQPANRWRGIVPPSDHPRSFNPPEGFVAAANARVNALGAGPLVSADNAPPYRIRRIQQVLGSSSQVGPSEMQSLQADWYDGQAQQLLPYLLDSLSGPVNGEGEPSTPPSEAAQEALARLEQWQPQPEASDDSAAALIFQHWYVELARELFAEPLGEQTFSSLLQRKYILNHALDAVLMSDDQRWWHGRKADRLVAALERTVDDLSDRLGTDQNTWRLDGCHQLTLSHELGKAELMLAPLFNLKARGWGGSPATVGRASYRYDQPFQINHAATVRVVIEMSAIPQAAAVIPGGQSGHPVSAHYADQLDQWLKGELIPIYASPAEVPGDTLLLTPATP